ncbi:uncharacterized protein LOC116842229 [Odontomachus brunneus]|uniref:uncharacterized protein LOC116842229 n=1 Tax=Odontomachus brunneus TaxID=486640 RepID=UPI0013F2413C|nr:uncharacterized protein LOC116842229 [Odontomachus brunneus]
MPYRRIRFGQSELGSKISQPNVAELCSSVIDLCAGTFYRESYNAARCSRRLEDFIEAEQNLLEDLRDETDPEDGGHGYCTGGSGSDRAESVRRLYRRTWPTLFYCDFASEVQRTWDDVRRREAEAAGS